jgi:sporulation protein YunB
LPKFRQRRRRKGPLPFRYVFLLTCVIFIFLTACSFWIINKQVEPALMEIAEIEATKIATTIIQEAVKNEIVDSDKAKDLVTTTKDKEGNITMITFDSQTVRGALNKVTENIHTKLSSIEEDNFKGANVDKDNNEQKNGITYEIPLGQITGNAILSSLGPDIPVRFYLIGDIHTDIKREIIEHGINNATHEVLIYTEVTVQMIIPFATESKKITNLIPVIDITVPGDVPQYYNGNGKSNPAIELPK